MTRFLFLLLFMSLIASGPLLAEVQADKPILNLNELVQEALQNNPEIQASKKNWEASREKVDQASALQDPMLGFSVVSLPTSFSFTEEEMTMKEISLSQMVPFPGKRPLMKAMAEKEAEAVSTEVREKENSVIREVKKAYFDLSHIYRVIEVTKRNKEILEDFVRIAKTRYEVGEGIQQDLLRAYVEVSRMVDELIMLEQQKKAVEAKLVSVLNRPPGTGIVQPEEVTFRKVPFDLASLQKAAVDSNPVLAGMGKMIESKEKARLLARKEYYPDFNVRFAYGQRDNSMEMERRDVLTAMVEVNLPVFYKSKQRRKVLETEAELESTKAKLHAMRNETLYMIADMVSMVERVERQLELYRTGIVPQATLQVNSALTAYRVNKVDIWTLLDSQMTLYRYQLEYHRALTEYEKNLAGLEWAVGKQFTR